MKDEATKNMDE